MSEIQRVVWNNGRLNDPIKRMLNEGGMSSCVMQRLVEVASMLSPESGFSPEPNRVNDIMIKMDRFGNINIDIGLLPQETPVSEVLPLVYPRTMVVFDATLMQDNHHVSANEIAKTYLEGFLKRIVDGSLSTITEFNPKFETFEEYKYYCIDLTNICGNLDKFRVDGNCIVADFTPTGTLGDWLVRAQIIDPEVTLEVRPRLTLVGESKIIAFDMFLRPNDNRTS